MTNDITPSTESRMPISGKSLVAGPDMTVSSEPPAFDSGTPGFWFVRKLKKDGVLVDCFVAAPDCNGFPYEAEILGDDEYRDEEDDGSGLRRKLADCELIVRAVNGLRGSAEGGSQSVLQRHALGFQPHLNRGSCPDALEGPNVRDGECPVCVALIDLMSDMPPSGEVLPDSGVERS